MSQKRGYGVNWEPYFDEIISLYVTQDKTAEEMVEHLQKTHSLQVA